MRLRWITVLCALTLKICLIGATLLLGCMVLERNYATLEREHAEGDLTHVCVILQSQMEDLNVMAREYAAWDDTYSYMVRAKASYVTSGLSGAVFQVRGINLYMLVDVEGKVVLAQHYGDEAGATLEADREQLVRAVKRRSRGSEPVAGLMTLTSGPAMVAMRPVLPTNEKGAARGTLVMVRPLLRDQMATLSRLSDLPITISGTAGDAAEIRGNGELTHSEITTVPLDEERLLASTMLKDLWGQPRIRLQIEHDRSIWRQGKQTIRALLLVLLVVGLLFAAANVWLMQRLVVRRVERLIRFTNDAASDGGLNARVQISGSDEIALLGRRMNQMLERLQISQEKLLGVQERLRYEASHDNLTGIWNRCAAMQLLDQELARSERDGSSVAAIMFDADHFKRINDHFGHSTGDRALQAIAAAITRNLRSFDICCRYGGEEFLVIAPKCNLEQATRLAERILSYLRGSPVTIPDHSFCVTLSAGVTAGTSPCAAEDLVMVADRALYRAKAKGRDCVQSEGVPESKAVRNQWLAAEGIHRVI